MITNEKQYKISRKKVTELNEAIERINNDPKKDALKKKLLIGALVVSKEEIEQAILFYEKTREDKAGNLKERPLSELPSLLIEYKIKSGLTQKQFAAQLGIKEQQLQRYEADNFRSVTFKNLIRFLDAIGLEITIKETRMTRTNKNRKKQSPK